MRTSRPNTWKRLIVMNKLSVLKALNKLIAPRLQLNETLATVISAQHEGAKLDNVLIIGDSSTGKSHTLNAIRLVAQLPVAELNVKLILQARARQEIEDVVRVLYANSKFNKARTERGIVLIDNIEALANSKAQLELIKLIRGADYRVTSFEDSDLATVINTKNMLFICTAGADKLKAAGRKAYKIGYNLPSLSEVNAKRLLFRNESLAIDYKTKLTEIGVVSELTNLFATTLTLENSLEAIRRIIPSLTAEVLAKYAKGCGLKAKVVANNKTLSHIAATAYFANAGVWGIKVIIHNMLQMAIAQAQSAKSSSVIMISYDERSYKYVVSNVLSVS
ncbi:MAG: AAA family ATPase [Candidatus Hodgkinia cicadicola]